MGMHLAFGESLGRVGKSDELSMMRLDRLGAALVWAALSLLSPVSCAPEPPPPAGSKLPTALAYQLFCLEHSSERFPEQPGRITVILDRLKQAGLTERLRVLHPLPATLETIGLVHTPAYIDHVRQTCRGLKEGVASLDRADVVVSCRSFEVAVAAVGIPLGAVDEVMQGRVANAFCVLRPPGHHAQREQAMGFCIFNNVAITAKYLQTRWNLKKVLIVDWDAHHGNGTQEIFYQDGSVFYFSTHCTPLFPQTGSEEERGKGSGKGCILNVPLPRWSGDADIRRVYEEKLKPAVLAFKPDFILISAGFDSQMGEEAGKLNITAPCFGYMTRVVKELADTCCKGRLVSVLEGGYDLRKLPDAAEAHVRALME
jgi:acetoin utilization deacetylase AcuC-like enzyme